MALTDLESVIGQVVVHDVGQVVAACEETQDAAIIVQELLLGLNLATTETLLHEVSHLGVVDSRLGDLRLLEVVSGCSGCSGEGSSLACIEFTSVVITVVDADLAAEDASVAANGEIVWHEWAAIGLQNDLTLEESTLRGTRVHLLGLSDHDGLVFQVVENCDLPDLGVLEAGLDDVLLEETVESQDLLVKLDIGGLELLLNVRTEVVRELVVRVRHALSSLRGAEGTLGRLGDSVQGDGLILRVSDLIKMNM